MAIVFGSDAGIVEKPVAGFFSKMLGDIKSIGRGIANAFTFNLKSPVPPPKEIVFVDSGFTNVPGTSFIGSGVDNIDDIKQRHIISQEPILTVYVKKRAFYALRNENNFKYMDDGEKLFIRATKLLFEKKCSQIAAYESMTKLSTLLSEESEIDADAADLIADELIKISGGLNVAAQEALNLSYTAAVSSNAPNENAQLTSDQFDEVQKIVEEFKVSGEKYTKIAIELRKISKQNRLLKHQTQTTWVANPDFPDLFGTGRGVGVIELALVNDLTTSLNLDGEGSIDFTIQDPYNLTKISNEDVEMALSAALSELEDLEKSKDSFSVSELNTFFRGPQYWLETAKTKENELRLMRANRITGPAAEIIFEVKTSSSDPYNVVGTLSTITTTFNVNDFRIIMLQQPLNDRLFGKEDTLVKEIFDALQSYVTELMRIGSDYKKINALPSTSYARRNLRKHYLGKSIIQPMDCVNIYIRGKTTNEEGLIGPLAALLNKSKFIEKFSTDQKVSDAVLEEEMKMFGIDSFDIPLDFYKAIRTGSSLRNGGIHVFAGIITKASENYSASNGVYTTHISGQSNMKWLELSRVNRTPSLDQTQGLLEDPLTPFDIIVDSATGLVVDSPPLNAENKRRQEAGLLIFGTGSNPGQVLNESGEAENFTYDVVESNNGTQLILKHLPGLVYKWKENVISATRQVNLQTALNDSEYQTDVLRRDMGVNVLKEPFAGQDAANIISILVTGMPHNFESFVKNATSIGTYSTNNSVSNSSRTYFDSLFDILGTQNKTLGNFQPLKIVNSSPKLLQERLNLQTSLQSNSQEINKWRSELAKLLDQQNLITKNAASGSGDAETESIKMFLKSSIELVNKKISDLQEQFKKTASDAESKGLRIYGNDIAFDVGEGLESQAEDQKQTATKIRLKNILMQLRPQYSCKFNEDSNFLIIGDEYDKDLDIQAFAIEAIGSQEIDLWNSDYKFPLEICKQVAETLDFEFYMDSQGYIQFRPPRYNKVPLSLILKMFLMDSRENKKLYPDFLRNLFKTRLESFKDDLEILDLTITTEIILLGLNITTQDVNKMCEAIVGGMEVSSALVYDNNEQQMDDLTKSLDGLVISLANARNKLASKIGGKTYDSATEPSKSELIKEINDLNNPSSPNMYVNRMSHSNKISQLISRRQKILDITDKLKSQNNKYDADLSGGRFSSSPSEEILGPLQDLIEDDYNDFIGPGSSKRFIVYDDQIIQYNFEESSGQAFSHVEVNGQQDFIGEGPGMLGGVPFLWAGATDFDLWRQYGFISARSITRPFLKNAETQCAPYAMMLLARARKNIITGTITIAGNEYYQLGDVIYVNSRDMLFYVYSISHSFSYESGTFTTTLGLKYGHSLGEYIPTPLDVIGKSIIKNGTKFNKVTFSRETANKTIGVHLGFVKFYEKESDDEYKAMLSGVYGEVNYRELVSSLMGYSNNSRGENYPKIEIRGFLTSDKNKEKIKKRIDAVINWLLNPQGKYDEELKGYATIADRVQVQQLSEKNNDISKFREPINISKKDLKPHEIARLPKDEVFNIALKDNGTIESVIELVLIYEKIEETK